MKTLAINPPEVKAENISFFQGTAKLKDGRTSVVLRPAGGFTKTVTDRLTGLYYETKAMFPNLDKKELNAKVDTARTAYLNTLGIKLEGEAIYVADQICWTMNKDRMGIGQAYYDELRDEVRTASDVKALNAIKKIMKEVKERFVDTAPDRSNLQTFHVGQFNRVQTAFETRESELADASASA